MQVVLQLILVFLWTAGMMALVVGIWYVGSLLVLGLVSRLLPLTGRGRRPHADER